MSIIWLLFRINAVVITIMSFILSSNMIRSSMFPWPLVITTAVIIACFSVGIAMERRHKWARKGAIALAIIALPLWAFLGYIVGILIITFGRTEPPKLPSFAYLAPGAIIGLSIIPSILLILRLTYREVKKEFDNK